MAREIKTYNLQIVCNVGNYESIRVGAEWTRTDAVAVSMADEMAEMDAELRKSVHAILDARKNPQPKAEQPKEQKQRLTFKEHAKTLQAIVKRIESGVSLDEVLKYYDPDEEAMRAIKMAAELNK